MGMRFRIVGAHEAGYGGIKPVKDYDPNKVYPLVGASFVQDQLVFFFINDQKKLWWVDHHKCICVDEQYYGQSESVSGSGGDNDGAAVLATTRGRKAKTIGITVANGGDLEQDSAAADA